MNFSKSFVSAADFEFLVAEGEILYFRRFKAMNFGLEKYNGSCTHAKSMCWHKENNWWYRKQRPRIRRTEDRRPKTRLENEDPFIVQLLSTKIVQISDTSMKLSQITKGPKGNIF